MSQLASSSKHLKTKFKYRAKTNDILQNVKTTIVKLLVEETETHILK